MLRDFRSELRAATVVVALAASPALANPLGGKVAAGSAAISGEGTASVEVIQDTQRAIINWNTFDLGKGETTTFVQPFVNSVTLNRVTGNFGASQIDGLIRANGNIFLINPNGILFGRNAVVDTAGLVATTNDIADENFMAGRYAFDRPGRPNASIVNEGLISVQDNGFAALVAPGVRNSGVITARLGKIGLASGNGFTLDFYGDGLITLNVGDGVGSQVVDVATGQPLDALVKNEGLLKADGGEVALTAVAARAVIDSVINNKGVIEANSVGLKNGKIVLGAPTASSKRAGAPVQKVKVAGKLSVAGKKKGETGGKIVVTGEAIEVAGADLDASGSAGGGTVLIGGDVSGGHPNPSIIALSISKPEPTDIPNATTVAVNASSTIDASALDQGDGGKVIVWSDDTTTFAGRVMAEGGTLFGSGGFVETSGRKTLALDGATDLSAPYGKPGTLLLDPLNATIQTDPGPGVITVSTIEGDLALSNVTVSTSAIGPDLGDITVASALAWSSVNTLTLSADRNIGINASISGLNGGLTVYAGGDVTALATVKVHTFDLETGSWRQVMNPLPGFSASDFRLGVAEPSKPLFLRALAGDGSAGLPYQIADVYGLNSIVSPTLANKSFVLVNDIDASITNTWIFGVVPTFQFNGTVDGLGHVVTNVAGPYVFADIGPSGVVRNVGLVGGAGFAFENDGTLDNVFWKGSAINRPGGLVSVNTGMISNSYAIGTLKMVQGGGLALSNELSGTITHSYASVNILGQADPFDANYLGGLVGFNFATITDSHATGSITSGDRSVVGGLVASDGGSISNSYATGAVRAGNFSSAGGLVGSEEGRIAQSHASGSVQAPNSAVGGLVGTLLNVLQVSGPGTFEGTIGGGSISKSFALGTVSGSSWTNITNFFGLTPVHFTESTIGRLVGVALPAGSYTYEQSGIPVATYILGPTSITDSFSGTGNLIADLIVLQETLSGNLTAWMSGPIQNNPFPALPTYSPILPSGRGIVLTAVNPPSTAAGSQSGASHEVTFPLNKRSGEPSGYHVNAKFEAHGPGPESDVSKYFAGDLHLGVDLKAAPGDDVFAPISGMIVYYHTKGNDGQSAPEQTFIVLRGDDGRDYVLGHIVCTVCTMPGVEDKVPFPPSGFVSVTKGEKIATVAYMAKAHLHFGINSGQIVDSSGKLMKPFVNGAWGDTHYAEGNYSDLQNKIAQAQTNGWIDPVAEGYAFGK